MIVIPTDRDDALLDAGTYSCQPTAGMKGVALELIRRDRSG